jgi:hypothetical protein
MEDKTPKAHLDALSTTTFCEICMDQKQKGNRPTAFLSLEGYKNLGREFGIRTGKTTPSHNLKINGIQPRHCTKHGCITLPKQLDLVGIR